MEGGLQAVGAEIAELDGRRAALLAALAQLEAQLARAHAKKADLEESRAVFEEGVAFSLDALQQQVRACVSGSWPGEQERAVCDEGTLGERGKDLACRHRCGLSG